MRSERKRREKEELLVRQKENKGKNGHYRIISIIYMLALFLFIGLMVWMNILPICLLVAALVTLGLITIFTVPVLFSEKGKLKRKKKACVVACVMIIVLAGISYYMAHALAFLNSISGYIGDVDTDRKSIQVDVTEEPFNILVSGIDVTGDIKTVSRSDVNMVVTVDPRNKEILLTSIPRDYYIKLPSKNAMDKLTHTGNFGAEETIGAVENLLDIEINYYVKVNYSTITNMVDAMGGIDIVSPYSFDTHGMSVYYHFDEGPIHLDGSHALAYCRERKSWVDGDMRRNENQQLVLEAMIKKATKGTTILFKYGNILDSIKGTIETDMKKSDMTDLVKMQLKDMASWNINKQAVKGTPQMAYCYSLGAEASVVARDDASVKAAFKEIERVMTI